MESTLRITLRLKYLSLYFKRRSGGVASGARNIHQWRCHFLGRITEIIYQKLCVYDNKKKKKENINKGDNNNKKKKAISNIDLAFRLKQSSFERVLTMEINADPGDDFGNSIKPFKLGFF